MKNYEAVLRLLLKESESLKNIPDETVLTTNLVLEDENGFKFEISKIGRNKKGKRLYKIRGENFSKIFDYNEIKKRFKRA